MFKNSRKIHCPSISSGHLIKRFKNVNNNKMLGFSLKIWNIRINESKLNAYPLCLDLLCSSRVFQEPLAHGYSCNRYSGTWQLLLLQSGIEPNLDYFEKKKGNLQNLPHDKYCKFIFYTVVFTPISGLLCKVY